MSLIILITFCLLCPAARSQTLTLNIGHLQGTYVLANQVARFLGVPYAQPPVGHLRYKPPLPFGRLNTTLVANKLPHTCYQIPFLTFQGTPSARAEQQWNPNTEMSEDCLYLNLWLPHTGGDNRLMLVWFYGGGFVSGSSSLDLYDGAELARESGAVVVTVNYRVASFGFLTSGTQDATTNNGLRDQMLALDFLNQNLAHLRVGHVRLFGESSGAASIGFHLMMQNMSSFHSAVLQSGAPNLPWAKTSLAEAQRRAKLLANGMNCTQESWSEVIGCLRVKDAATLANSDWLVEGPLQFTWSPTEDNQLVFEDVESRLQTGHFKRVPIVVGTNLNEAVYFLAYENPHWAVANRSQILQESAADAAFTAHLNHVFRFFPSWPVRASPTFLTGLAKLYRPVYQHNINNFYALDRAAGDYHFICGVNAFAEAFVKFNVSVNYYRFLYLSQENEWPHFWGALHGDEIRFLFGVPLRAAQSFPTKSQEVQLSKAMINSILMMSGSFPTLNDNPQPLYRRVRVFDRDSLGGADVLTDISSTACNWWKHSASELQAAGQELPPPLLSSPTMLGLLVGLVVCASLFLLMTLVAVLLARRVRDVGRQSEYKL